MEPSFAGVLVRARAEVTTVPFRGGLRALARGLRSAGWALHVAVLRRAGVAAAARAVVACHPALRVRILRAFGAQIGEGTTILGPLVVLNPGADFSALRVGRDTWIGPDVLVDLTRDVRIGDRVAVSARSSFVTHMNVGPSRLRDRHPPVAGPVRVGDDAYVGTGAVILHGVEIGEGALVAAGAVVRAPVSPGALVGGVPAREIRGHATLQ